MTRAKKTGAGGRTNRLGESARGGSFEGRLAAYGLAGGVLLGAGVAPAGAEIVHVDLGSGVSLTLGENQSQSLFLDLDTGTVSSTASAGADVELAGSATKTAYTSSTSYAVVSSTTDVSWAVQRYAAGPGRVAVPTSSASCDAANATTTPPSAPIEPLAANQQIAPCAETAGSKRVLWAPSAPLAKLHLENGSSSTNTNNFASSTGGILGLQFELDGQTHYGWARVRIDKGSGPTDMSRLTVLELAYERVADAPIEAGATTGGVTPPAPTGAPGIHGHGCSFDEGVPPEGALGLLALGAVGLGVWRESRRRAREQTDA